MNKGTKPQRPRTRGNGRGGRRNPSHGRQGNNRSNAGSEARIRGNAKQNLDKFLGLAKDAVSAGDRVAAENYFQHADHYFRVVQSVDGARALRNENARDDQAEGNMGGDDNDRPQGLPSGAVEVSFQEQTSGDDDDAGNSNEEGPDVVEVKRPRTRVARRKATEASNGDADDNAGNRAPAEVKEDVTENPEPLPESETPKRRRAVRKKVATV